MRHASTRAVSWAAGLTISLAVGLALLVPIPAHAQSDTLAERTAASAVRNAFPRQPTPWSPSCTTTGSSELSVKSGDRTNTTMVRRFKYTVECAVPSSVRPNAASPASCAVNLAVTSAAPGRITTGKVVYRYKAVCDALLDSGRVLRGSASRTSTAR